MLNIVFGIKKNIILSGAENCKNLAPCFVSTMNAFILK